MFLKKKDWKKRITPQIGDDIKKALKLLISNLRAFFCVDAVERTRTSTAVTPLEPETSTSL